MLNADPHNTDPCFLAIDPSLTSTGLAIARPSNAIEDFIVASTVVVPNPKLADHLRVQVVAEAIRAAHREFPIHWGYVESPTSLYVGRNRGIDALKVLLVLGAVYAATGYLNLKIHPVTVREWKGAGRQYKEVSVKLVEAVWGKTCGDDEAEACLLALAVVQPDELKAAIRLATVGAPMDRAIGVLKREWEFGARELARIEELAKTRQLKSWDATKRRRAPRI